MSDDAVLAGVDAALRQIAVRPRSIAEVRQFLHNKKLAAELIESVIARLIQNNYLNDYDFAKWFIEQRLRFRPKGASFLKRELQLKGVPKDVIDTVFSDHPVSDVESAQALLSKKIRIWKELPARELREKAMRFLLARGYSWEVVKTTLSHISVFDEEGV